MTVPASCASTADGGSDAEQPEHDYIKMFVGQIPRAMNEQDLMEMFGEFGRVYQLNLLRDKFTGVSKGNVFHFIQIERVSCSECIGGFKKSTLLQ